MEALKRDLTSYNHDEMSVDCPNSTYDAFFFTLLELYTKHHPFRKCWVKGKYKGKAMDVGKYEADGHALIRV